MSRSRTSESGGVRPQARDDSEVIPLLFKNASELSSEYRKRKNPNDYKSVHPADAPVEEAKGWTIQRPGKRSSTVVAALNANPESPFYQRFARHGVPPEPGRNLTISEVVNGLRRSGLIGKVARNMTTLGPLSAATDQETVERASRILSAYFGTLRDTSLERWEAGRNAYIAVNPGIRAQLNVFSETVNYLSHKKSLDFALLSADALAKHVIEFCTPIFEYIRDASDDTIREKFSRKFGEGGVKEYTYNLMQILRGVNEDFGSEEFLRWEEQSRSQMIDEANQFLMKLSERLTDYVIDALKEIHGTHQVPSGEHAYWEFGVESKRIRGNAFKAQQEDKHPKRKEAYLNIVDLKEIVKQRNNWDHFEHVFNNPRPGERRGQKYYLSWVHTFNDLRNTAAHKNQLKTYSDDDLNFVDWLRAEVSPKLPE